LYELDFSNNSINDISALAGKTTIHDLSLSNNKIIDISALLSNTGLGDAAGDYVNLHGNTLTNPAQEVTLSTQRAFGVTVVYP
jgi:Leucine-rich repeat (LRR) protein